jgi:Flp pilus assembly protein TadD
MALAGAWYALAVTHRTDGAIDNAATALDTIVRKDDAPAEAVLLRGLVADRLGDSRAAEDFYRRGLRLNPDAPEAMNNLAYLILLRGGDLEEAHALASRAIALSPATAGFHDTLGRILAKQGKPEAAIEQFNTALRLDPDNLEALVGLATTLIDSGKRDVAANLLTQIDALLKSRPSMSPQLRKEVEALRATMKASL